MQHDANTDSFTLKIRYDEAVYLKASDITYSVYVDMEASMMFGSISMYSYKSWHCAFEGFSATVKEL